MRTIDDEMADAISRFRESADRRNDEYREHADRFEETGEVIHAARAEYALGQASGFLAAANQLHQLRAAIRDSGVDRVPVKGQRVPCACAHHDDGSVTTFLCPQHADDDPCWTKARGTGRRRKGSIIKGVCSTCGWSDRGPEGT
jgi:hypothetical protein